MNNYNKIQKAKNEIAELIEFLGKYEGNINPKKVALPLTNIQKTLNGD